MVNSWGPYFGNGGFAYVMYRTLAQGAVNGIYNSMVNGVHVVDNVVPNLTMRVKMQHNQRNKVRILAGISTDLSRTTPEAVALHPMFSKQGGAYHMRGNVSTPIELSEDISELIEDIDLSSPVKIFLVIMESDSDGTGNGIVNDFSVIDANGIEHVCESHNVSIENNGFTFISLVLALPVSNAEAIMENVSIYPNPTKDILNIKTTDVIRSIKLIDSLGRIILEGASNILDISSVKKGIYFLHVTNTQNQTLTQRIIKE